MPVTNLSAIIDFAVCGAQTIGHSRPWTPEEDDFIRANTLTMTRAQMAEILGRSEAGVKIHMTRHALPPTSNQPGWITANKAAKILRIDSHSMTKLCQRDLIPYITVPGLRMTKLINLTTFWVWVVNPMHWIYFDPKHVAHPRLARLVALRAARWDDAWWTTRQAADYYGLSCSNSIEMAILRGQLSGVRWGNWYLLRSAVLAHPMYPGKGSNKVYRQLLSPAGQRFLFKARDEWGLTFPEIGRLMKQDPKYLSYFYRRMRRL